VILNHSGFAAEVGYEDGDRLMHGGVINTRAAYILRAATSKSCARLLARRFWRCSMAARDPKIGAFRGCEVVILRLVGLRNDRDSGP
jgi:hypothetical protein